MRDEVSWGVTLPSGRLVSRVGDGDVPGLEEDDCKGHVPLLAAEREKEISYLVFISRVLKKKYPRENTASASHS